MRNIKKTAAISMTMLVLAAGTASAKTIDGDNGGEVLNGTPRVDTISAYGGADLARGYGSADLIYGGNEAGWGDALYGGSGGDRIYGQDGKDALYGEGGSDALYGGSGGDLVAGGKGGDVLDGGPGADEIDARDGQKDTVVVRSGEGDVVYYDRGLDVFHVTTTVGTDAGKGAALTASEATDKGTELLAEKPPRGLFEPHGGVLVEHEGEKALVAEEDLAGHMAHGDEILDPTGRAPSEGGQR